MVGGSEEILCVCEGSWPVIACGDVGGGGSRDTDLEPDILESEVKWALESLANNKASGADGIPVELQ